MNIFSFFFFNFNITERKLVRWHESDFYEIIYLRSCEKNLARLVIMVQRRTIKLLFWWQCYIREANIDSGETVQLNFRRNDIREDTQNTSLACCSRIPHETLLKSIKTSLFFFFFFSSFLITTAHDVYNTLAGERLGRNFFFSYNKNPFRL